MQGVLSSPACSCDACTSQCQPEQLLEFKAPVIKLACGGVPRSAPLKVDVNLLLCGSLGPQAVLSYQQRPFCLPLPSPMHRLRACG